MGNVMTARFITVIKLAVFLTTLLMVAVGALWAADVFSKETAGDYAVKSLLIMGVFTAGMLVVAAIGGGPGGGPKKE
jgi:hypothetical protein